MSPAKSRALILVVGGALSLGMGVLACGSSGQTEPTRGATAATPDLTTQGVADTNCSFSVNVLEMFDASTNGTALPTATIGNNCNKDVRKFSAYKSLF